METELVPGPVGLGLPGWGQGRLAICTGAIPSLGSQDLCNLGSVFQLF